VLCRRLHEAFCGTPDRTGCIKIDTTFGTRFAPQGAVLVGGASGGPLPTAGETTGGAAAFPHIRRPERAISFELPQLPFPLRRHLVPAVVFAAGARLGPSSIIAIRRSASGRRKQLVVKPGELRFTPQAQSAEPRPVGLEVREVGEELREKSRE
jgi:hypothetical protein